MHATAGRAKPNDEGDRRKIDQEILALAVPALGALALDPVLSLIDTAFIGRLGDSEPLAGVGIASIVLSMSFSTFNFLAMATTPLVARALGSQSMTSSDTRSSRSVKNAGRTDATSPMLQSSLSDRDEEKGSTSRIISAGIYLSVMIGCIAGSTLFLNAVPLCRALGASPGVLPHAVAYLRARVAVFPFVLTSFVGNGSFRGLKDTRTPFAIALVANAVNLVLDPILIFSCGLGAQGAAIATSVSQVVAVTLMLMSMIRRKRLYIVDLLRIPKVQDVVPLLRAGAALTVRTFSILGTVAYATATASTLGSASMAAFEITRQLFVFHAMILDSIAAAAQALVSNLMAQKSFMQARRVANRTLQLGALFGSFIGIAAVTSGAALPGIFTRSRETRDLTVSCIRIACLCTPLNGSVFALDGILAATRDYSYMALAIAFAGFLAVSALTVVRWVGGGVAAVWAALNVLMMARGLVLFARYCGRNSPVPSIQRCQSLAQQAEDA